MATQLTANTANSITATGTYNLPKDPAQNQTMVAFSGTYTTASFTFLGSFDGTNFFNLGCLDLNTQVWNTGATTITLTNSTNRGFLLPTQGMAAVQVSTTGPATGTLSCFFYSGSFTANPFLFASLSGSTAQSFTSTVTVQSTSANAFDVGANGATNPVVQVDASTSSVVTGMKFTGAASGSGMAMQVISSSANDVLTLDAKGAAAITLNGQAAGALGVNIGSTTAAAGTVLTVTSTSASALMVGPAGATNPSLQVDASTGSAVTGLKIKAAASASGLALSVVSSSGLEPLTIDAKGAGGLTLQGTATGAITLGANVTLADAKNFTINTGTGTKIGTATGQKIGFYNATPVVQPAANTDTSTGAAGSVTGTFLNTTWTGNGGTAAFTVGGVVTALKALGLLAA